MTLAAEALLEGEAGAPSTKQGRLGAAVLPRALCPIQRDRVVTVDIPEIGSAQDASKAAAAVLAACAAGEISTNDAANLIGLLGTYVRLLETGDIEQRLQALEAASGGSS